MWGIGVAHVVGVVFPIKGKGVGEDIVVAVVRTAIVEHTLGRDAVPSVEIYGGLSSL